MSYLCYATFVSRFILCPTKASKVRKIHCFFLKNQDSLFISDIFFFPQNDIKKNLYATIPEMPNSNPKTSIQKYLIFCSWYNVFHY